MRTPYDIWTVLAVLVLVGLITAALICLLVYVFDALPDCQTLFHNITGHQIIDGHRVQCFDGNVVGVSR